MTNPPVVASPRAYARVAGLLYLVVIVCGAFAELGVRGQLVVPGNAVATANNIVAHELKYRIGFACELVGVLCTPPLAVIFYELFKVVNRRVIVLAILFSLVGTAVESVSLLNHLAPLTLLGGAGYLRAIPLEQLQAQAYLSLRLFELGFAISLAFFSFFCMLVGYLIFVSRILPRFVGALLAFQGVCYLVNSLTDFLAPRFAGAVFSLLAVSVIGELSLCLWLLVKGVNVTRWTELAEVTYGPQAGLIR